MPKQRCRYAGRPQVRAQLLGSLSDTCSVAGTQLHAPAPCLQPQPLHHALQRQERGRVPALCPWRDQAAGGLLSSGLQLWATFEWTGLTAPVYLSLTPHPTLNLIEKYKCHLSCLHFSEIRGFYMIYARYLRNVAALWFGVNLIQQANARSVVWPPRACNDLNLIIEWVLLPLVMFTFKHQRSQLWYNPRFCGEQSNGS